MSDSRVRDETSVYVGAEIRPGPWDADTFASAFRVMVRQFEPAVASINALNVFPVPDGDTGTNMHLTLQAAIQELSSHHDEKPARVDELVRLITRGALMGARGNSGVILYQIIAGMAAGLEDHEVLDVSGLVRGFEYAADMAYRAVNNPVEGTMLSVIRAVSDACHDLSSDSTLTDALETARDSAAAALERTPDQLPVLRQAGVVDAGGQGLVTMLTSLAAFATGSVSSQPSDYEAPHPASFASEMHFLDQAEVIHGLEEFGYCINFVVSGEDLEGRGIRQTLDAIGTSTVIVGDDTLMKVHTHSEHPGTILEAALTFGELHEIRIDNMKSQTERLLSERHATVEPYHFEPPSPVELTIGIVAVGAGDGVIQALRGMGAQAIVSGGASMNPSTGEIRDAVESLDTGEVIILPNDSNILASARHAANISTKDVRVVPTTSIQQGIAALAAFNFEANLEENQRTMTEAAEFVRSLALTRASRDVEIDGMQFRAGQFMGMLDGKPRVTGANAREVLCQLFAVAGADDFELATVFVGESADREFVDQIEELIQDQHPELEFEVTDGGQPHYDLLISLE